MFKRMSRTSQFLIGGAVVAAVVIVLVIVLSGGSGHGSGPTKAQYLAKADAICQTTASRMNPLIASAKSGAVGLLTGSSGAAAQLAPIFKKLQSATASGLAQLQALKQPSGDHAAIEAFLTPLAAVVTAVGDATADLRAGNSAKAVQLFEQTLSIAPQVTSAAQAYGYMQCSQLVSALHA